MSMQPEQTPEQQREEDEVGVSSAADDDVSPLPSPVTSPRQQSGSKRSETTVNHKDSDNVNHNGDNVTYYTARNIQSYFFPGESTEEQLPPMTEEEEIIQDRRFVERFWKTYDDLLILSVFTQIGIIFRIAAAHWFAKIGNTFSPDSALFVNLPLNCLSCWLLGFFSSGEDTMSILQTRFTPMPKKRDIQIVSSSSPNSENDSVSLKTNNPSLRNRRIKRQRSKLGEQELREVQFMALERRIRKSPCLVLFHLQKEDDDIMEHYFEDGYRKRNCFTDDDDCSDDSSNSEARGTPTTASLSPLRLDESPQSSQHGSAILAMEDEQKDSESGVGHPMMHRPDFLHDVQNKISDKITRMKRVDLAEGWDVGTSYEDMSDDLMLGLRDGFCGAISSFSSWSSSMVGLLQAGNIGSAITGYTIGLQLPIVSYRFGQTCAVYLFVWRCRRETRSEERRGYRFRIRDQDDFDEEDQNSKATSEEEPADRETPSVRAIATAIFLLLIVTELTSLSFFTEPEDHLVALSLLFSPFGVIARWRLSRRYNSLIPGFPLGTFTCNLLACALSGSLGSLLAGNPGPRERIVLVSMISGFAGSLSSVAMFIVEILKGIDPLLFKFDGVVYALCTLFWAMVIGFVSSQTLDWADAVATKI